MKIRFSSVALGAAIAVASSVAFGGVNEKMAEMFGAQSNITRPGVAESATRGVITGGNVTIRTPIAGPVGVPFDPPSISAGCGGIDLYGGNLSFPSKEQFIATGRAVVGNIGGYAFRLALQNACPSCESIMTDIQNLVQDMNMGNLNSCQIAKGIVDGDAAGGMQQRANDIAASWKQLTGRASDRLEAYNQGGASPALDAVSEPAMANLQANKWTRMAMDETEALNWLGGDKRTREELMTLLGTVVTCVAGTTNCSENEADAFKVLEPKLRLQDFVALDAQRLESYQVYSCGDSDCLQVSTTSERSLGTSAAQKVVDVLLGPVDAPDTGVLNRMIRPGTQVSGLTAAEKSLIGGNNEIVAKAVLCYRSGEHGRGYARTLVEGMAPQIAADVLYMGMQQSLIYLNAEVAKRGQAVGSAQALAQLKESAESLRRQHAEISERSIKSDTLRMAIERCSASPMAHAATIGVQR